MRETRLNGSGGSRTRTGKRKVKKVGPSALDKAVHGAITRADERAGSGFLGVVVLRAGLVTGAAAIGSLAARQALTDPFLPVMTKIPVPVGPGGWLVVVFVVTAAVGVLQWAWTRDRTSEAVAPVDSHLPADRRKAPVAVTDPALAQARQHAARAQEVAEGAVFGVTGRVQDPAHAPAQDTTSAATTAAAVPAQDTPQPDAAPRTAGPQDAAARARDLLVPLFRTDSELHVTIADTHTDGSPQQFEIRYHPRATIKVRDNLVDVRDLIARRWPPRADDWVVKWDARRDVVTFTDAEDPLARDIPLPDLEENLDVFSGIPLGIYEDGADFRLGLFSGSRRSGNHVLIAGESGSGKGSWLHGTIRSLAPLARLGYVRFHLIDAKGGQELGAYQDVAYKYADFPSEQVTLVLHEFQALMERKQAQLKESRQRNVPQISRRTPLDFLIIDEMAAVVGKDATPQERQVNQPALNKILSQGRSSACLVMGAVQDPRKENLEMRGKFQSAVSLKVDSPATVDMILAKGARLQGALADMIPMGLPGTGYVAVDGTAGYRRVRPAYVSDPDIEEVVEYLQPVT